MGCEVRVVVEVVVVVVVVCEDRRRWVGRPDTIKVYVCVCLCVYVCELIQNLYAHSS